MKRAQRLSAWLITLVLVFFSIVSANAASPSQGATCKKIGQIFKSGKDTFICESSLNGARIMKQKLISTSSKTLAKNALSLSSEISNLDISKVNDLINSETALIAEINAVKIRINELQQLIVIAKFNKTQAESDVSSLPSRLSQSKSTMEQSKAATILPQQTFLSLNSQLNSMSYEYDSAQRAKGSYLACRVLNDFGFTAGGCGSYNSYYDVVISRYNSLKYQVDSAMAVSNSYAATFNSNLESYNNLLNSQSQLTTKITTASQSIISLTQEINLQNIELTSRLKVTSIIEKVKDNLDYYVKSTSILSEQINSVLSTNSKNWNKNLGPLFRTATLLQYNLDIIGNVKLASVPSITTPTPVVTGNSVPVNSYKAYLDKASYVLGEIATLVVTAIDSSGNAVPDGTQLAPSQESLLITFLPNNFAVSPKFNDVSSSGRWTYRLIINSTISAYSGSLKIGNMPEQRIPYTVRNSG
jgi:hypothetical protein